MGMDHRRKRNPRELVNIQGSLPPGSRIVHHYGQEIKQRVQETIMYEKGTAGGKKKKIKHKQKGTVFAYIVSYDSEYNNHLNLVRLLSPH